MKDIFALLDVLIQEVKENPIGKKYFFMMPKAFHEEMNHLLKKSLSLNMRIFVGDENLFLTMLMDKQEIPYQLTKSIHAVVEMYHRMPQQLSLYQSVKNQPAHLFKMYEQLIIEERYQFVQSNQAFTQLKQDDIAVYHQVLNCFNLTPYSVLDSLKIPEDYEVVYLYDGMRLPPVFMNWLTKQLSIQYFELHMRTPDKMALYELKSMREEVLTVVKNIVESQIDFNQQLILYPNNQYLETLIDSLSNHQIPFQMKKRQRFIHSHFGRWFLTIINQNNVSDAYFLKQQQSSFEPKVDCTTFSDYSHYYQSILEYYVDFNQLTDNDQQFYNQVIKHLADLDFNYEVNLSFYQKLLQLQLHKLSIKVLSYKEGIHLMPINQVGLSKYEVVHILGCDASQFMTNHQSSGLYTIDELDEQVQFNPTLPFGSQYQYDEKEIIMKRLLSSGQQLSFYYAIQNQDGKSQLLASRVKQLHLDSIHPVINEFVFDYPSLKKYLFNHQMMVDDIKQDDQILLSQALSFNNQSQLENEELIRKFYLKQPYVSISRIELFNRCPFAHFVRYGLKPHLPVDDVLDPRVIGTIVHEVIREVSLSLPSNTIKDDLLSTIDAVLQSVILLHLTEEMIDSHYFNAIKKQMLRMLYHSLFAVNEQLLNSRFVLNGIEKEVVVELNNDWKLKAIIDRIDIMVKDDSCYVSIIDYKTGDKRLKLDQVYYQENIQLFVYLDSLMKQLSSQYKNVYISGIFYFHVYSPILDSFLNEEQELLRSYQLKGYVIDEPHIVESYNEAFKVVPASVKKDGQLAAIGNYLSYDQFIMIKDAVMKNLLLSADLIKEGKIDISPSVYQQKRPCDYCEYRPICQKDNFYNEERILEPIDEEVVIEKWRR